jgi:hypothetical protein
VGGAVAAVKPWATKRWRPQSEHGGSVVRTVWLTSGAHAVLYFSRIIQTGSNLKIENRCLTLLQKFPIFACS